VLVNRSFEHRGVERSYLLHVPPGHKKESPAPLVLVLHGGGGTAKSFDRFTNGQVIRESDRRGWLVAFPEGVEKGWDDGRTPLDDKDRLRATMDDVGFLMKVIDRVDAEQGVDRSRVYATGISNGGFMSFRLALEQSDRFAAVAPVSANLAKVHEHTKPKRAIPILVVNGTLDPLVPWKGGQVQVLGRDRGEVLSTPDTVAWWVKQNACSGKVTTKSLPDTDPEDGTRVEVETHDGCAGGSEVVLYRIEGGGHSWPGGTQYLPKAMVGTVCRDFEAATAIFDFFAKHRR
jgi:polyhydroxybutyrate depolymerase